MEVKLTPDSRQWNFFIFMFIGLMCGKSDPSMLTAFEHQASKMQTHPHPHPHPVSCWSPACSHPWNVVLPGERNSLIQDYWVETVGSTALDFPLPGSLESHFGLLSLKWERCQERLQVQAGRAQLLPQICFLFLPLRRSGCSEWSKTALGSEKSAAVGLNLAPPLGMVTWAYFSPQKVMFYQGNKATTALKEKCGTFGGNTVSPLPW